MHLVRGCHFLCRKESTIKNSIRKSLTGLNCTIAMVRSHYPHVRCSYPQNVRAGLPMLHSVETLCLWCPDQTLRVKEIGDHRTVVFTVCNDASVNVVLKEICTVDDAGTKSTPKNVLFWDALKALGSHMD